MTPTICNCSTLAVALIEPGTRWVGVGVAGKSAYREVFSIDGFGSEDDELRWPGRELVGSELCTDALLR